MTSQSQGNPPLVLLHGVGQAPMAWEDLVVQLYGTRRLLTPWVPGLRPTESAPIPVPEAAAALDQVLMLEGAEQIDLCGHSFGALVAAQLAADFPERVRRLVLVSGQVRAPRALMRMQSAMLKLVPAARLVDAGVSKDRLLAALEVARQADLTEAIGRIKAPTLVLVGAKDKVNQPGSRALADGIPDATLQIVDGAGHQLNQDCAQALAVLLAEFLD